MTLQKLKQEGRMEFDQKFPNEVSGYIDKEGKYIRLFMPAVDVDDIIVFLTTQIQKAYLSALSDVEKGLPKKVDLKDRFWGKSEVEYGFEHTHNNVLSAVKELINKLKESK